MTDSVLPRHPESSPEIEISTQTAPEPSQLTQWIARFVMRMANLQVFLEWFHRLDAALLGLSSLVLFAVTWWKRRQLPTWLPWASTLVVGLIVFQGALGGLTVTELLRFDIVTAHLGTALLYFTTLLVIRMALIPYQGTGTVGKLPWVSLSAAIFVYAQSILGALVGSQWALHQCFGANQLCQVMNSHIAGVAPASLATIATVWLAWRTPALSSLLRQLANWLAGLLVLQVALGVATFRLHLQVAPLTVAHQAIGAALLGTLVAFTVLAWRDRVTVKAAEPTASSSVPSLTNVHSEPA
jgi:cytochrome c oxidase assembly protein subunit 15